MGCECKKSTNKCSKGCANQQNILEGQCNSDNECKKLKQDGGVEKFQNKKQYNINYFELDSIYNLNGGSDNINLSNWKNNQNDGPVSYYPEIVARYGNPDILVNQPGGLCIWNIDEENDPHTRIELKDEYVPHCVPMNHFDFMYSYVTIYISPDMLNKVQSISGSVSYDPLKHELFARCGSFAANFATLRTVFNVLEGTNTDYSKNIKSKDTSSESNFDYVLRKVKDNQKKYKKELTWQYYPGAFPQGCK